MKKIIYVSLGFLALLSVSLTAKKTNSFEADVEQATKITEKKVAKTSKVSTKKKRKQNTSIKITLGILATIVIYIYITPSPTKQEENHYVPLPDIDEVPDTSNEYVAVTNIDEVSDALNKKALAIDHNEKNKTDKSLVGYSMYDRLDRDTKLNFTKQYIHDKGEKADRSVGAMVGMAIGDATGAPLEFLKCLEEKGKSYFDLKGKKWVNDHNKFRLKRGQWTDDAAMGLCMADSLIQCGKFDGSDIRIRFWNWWHHGYNNAFRLDKKRSTKTSVGLGGNISKSIHVLKKGIPPPEEFKDKKGKDDAGNGSLMRLAPIPIFFCHADMNTALEYAKKSSFTTHQGLIAAECCALMTYIIIKAIQRDNSEKDIKVFLDRVTSEYLHRIEKEVEKLPSQDDNREAEAKECVIRLLKSNEDDSKERNWNWKNKKGNLGIDTAIKKRGSTYNTYPNSEGYFGSYSMDGLAMALHAVYNSKSFGTAIENAVNLLGDADSTGSIAGQIAGAFYGLRDVMSDKDGEKYLFDLLSKWDDYDISLRATLLFEIGKKLS